MASRHDWHWTFGNRCHIEFPGGGDPVNAPPQSFMTDEGCATTSDAAGNLLFYTDGSTLYDGNHASIATIGGLGGSNLSTHSALIVPPPSAGGSYYVFGVGDWTSGPPLLLCTVVQAPAPNAVSVFLGPNQMTIGPPRPAERLAAVSTADCKGFWVVWLNLEESVTLQALPFYGAIGTAVLVLTAYPWTSPTPEYCVKFSPDGTLFAVTAPETIDLLSFDRATGLFTAHSQVIGLDESYGVEFSPNGKYLYYSGRTDGHVHRHTIGAPGSTTSASANDQISQWPPGTTERLGALQLGPNGKIYGARVGTQWLIEIGDPDNANPAMVKFKPRASDANGNDLKIDGNVRLGLPTFARIANDCQKVVPVEEDRCARLAAEVDKQLAGVEKFNPLRPCRDDQPFEKPDCHPLEIPPIAPWTSIRWGDSRCDCIEGDDTEVMHLTICNPYKNLTLSNLVVNQLIVVDAKGNPVPLLPDGSPSIQLVPIGPYCFDDIAPCTCVTREFSVRLRGAPHGTYHIKLRGICFDACFHGDGDACFQFDVCKD